MNGDHSAGPRPTPGLILLDRDGVLNALVVDAEHGTADSPADGGVAVTNIQMARDFEAKLRAAGTPVEAVYYEGGRHNDIFASSTQYRDEVQKMVTFLRRHLHE